jgi:hypothetical protein
MNADVAWYAICLTWTIIWITISNYCHCLFTPFFIDSQLDPRMRFRGNKTQWPLA